MGFHAIFCKKTSSVAASGAVVLTSEVIAPQSALIKWHKASRIESRISFMVLTSVIGKIRQSRRFGRKSVFLDRFCIQLFFSRLAESVSDYFSSFYIERVDQIVEQIRQSRMLYFFHTFPCHVIYNIFLIIFKFRIFLTVHFCLCTDATFENFLRISLSSFSFRQLSIFLFTHYQFSNFVFIPFFQINETSQGAICFSVQISCFGYDDFELKVLNSNFEMFLDVFHSELALGTLFAGVIDTTKLEGLGGRD